MGNRQHVRWIEALDQVSKTRNINARGVRKCIAESLSCGPPEEAREMLLSILRKDASYAKEVIASLLARYSEAAEPCNKNTETGEQNKENNGISESLHNRMDIDQTMICFPESVTDCCRNAFREITMKDKFGELFNLVQNKQKEMLDFNLIDIRMNMGTYGKAPELFASDMKKVATLFREKAGDKGVVDASENTKVGSETEEHLLESLQNLNQHHLSEANNQQGSNARAEEHITNSSLSNLNENGQNGRLNGGLEVENTSPNEDVESKDGDNIAQCVSHKQCDNSYGEKMEISAHDHVCRSCGANERDNCIVLCTACKAAYHIYCISPALEHIPSEAWYCVSCVGSEKGNESVPKYNGVEGHHCSVCERLSKELEAEKNGVEFHTGGGLGTYCNQNVACLHGNKEDADINQGEGTGREDTEVHASMEEEKLHGNEPLARVCKVCSSGERDGDNLIECANTNCLFKYFHLRCLKPPLKCNPPANWYCPSCICVACQIDENDDQIVLCDGCDDGYHIYCVKPRLSKIPMRDWYCSSCRKMRRRRTNKGRYFKGNPSTEVLQGSNPSMAGNPSSRIGRGAHDSHDQELHTSIPQDQLQATQIESPYSIAPEEPGVNSDENFGTKEDNFRISFRTRNASESEEGTESKEYGKRKRKSSEPRRSEGQEKMGRGLI